MELTQEDRQRIEQEARLHYSANNNYPMEQAAFKKGAEYATIFERSQSNGALYDKVSEQSQRITKLVTQLDICRESLKLSTQEHSAERHRANHAVELYQETKARNAQLEEALRLALSSWQALNELTPEDEQRIEALLTHKP